MKPNLASYIVALLLEAKRPNDLLGIVYGDQEDLDRMAYEKQAKDEWLKDEQKRKDSDFMRGFEDVAAHKTHVPSQPTQLRKWQPPARYRLAKQRIRGLVKRKSGAAHVASVEIIPGGQPPKIASGSSGGFFTKGGTRIDHPGAYSKKGWSNMEYLTNDEHATVGVWWLKRWLPDALATVMRYNKGSIAGEDVISNYKNHVILKFWSAYDSDDH